MRVPETPMNRPQDSRRLLAPEPDRQAGQAMLTMGKGMEHIGDVAFNLAERWQKQEDTDHFVAAQNTYAQGMSVWMQEQESQRQGAKARGVSRDFKTRHAELVEEASQDLSDRSKEAFANWSLGRASQGLSTMLGFERQQGLAYGQDTHKLRVQGIFESVQQKPALWQDAAKELEASYALAVGQGIYRPEEAKLAYGETKKKLHGVAFDGLYAADRTAAMKGLASFGFGQGMEAKIKERYQAELEHEQRVTAVRRSEQLRGYASEAKNAHALAELTGNTGPLLVMAEKFAAASEEESSQTLREQADLIDSNRAVILQGGSMPLQDVAERVQAIDQGLGAETDLHTAKKLTDERELLAKIYQSRVSQLDKNPAAAVDAWAVGDTLSQRMESRLALQERDGVPVGSRKPLTNEEATKLSVSWKAANMEEKTGMMEEFKDFGSAAPLVFAQVGMDPVECDMVNAALNDPEQTLGAHTVLAALAVPNEVVPTANVSTALQEVLETSAAVQGYSRLGGMMPGTLGLYKGYEKAAERLLKLGHSPDKVAELLDAGRTFVDADHMAVLLKPGQNPDIVEQGLNALVDRLPAFLEGRTDLTTMDRRDEARRLSQVGLWVNAPDEQGFVFVDATTGQPVRDSQGKLFTAHENTLHQAAVDKAVEYANTNPWGL